MTKIDANGIGMELAFNPTNRHVQGVIFSKDNSHVDNSPNFSNFTSTQSVENNLGLYMIAHLDVNLNQKF